MSSDALSTLSRPPTEDLAKQDFYPLTRDLVRASSSCIKNFMKVGFELPMPHTSVKIVRGALALHQILPESLACPRDFSNIRTQSVTSPIPGEWVECVSGVHSEPSKRKALLFLHGGGFLCLAPSLYRTMTVQLARLTSARVFVPDYRLAPEFVYPAQLDDVAAAYDYVLSCGYKPSDVFFVGDSAGGSLCCALLVKLITEGRLEKVPASVAVISPWLDLTGTLCRSRQTNAEKDIVLPSNIMALAATYYCPDSEKHSDPFVSPLFASDEVLEKFPRILFEVGSTEVLLDDSRLMCGQLVRNGVMAFLRIHTDEPHVFQVYGDYYAPAMESLRDISHFLLNSI